MYFYAALLCTFILPYTHAREAIHNASTNQAEEGSVGAGTGMICCDYKGGIGASSRLIQDDTTDEEYIVGSLVLSNFGSEEDLLQHKIFSNGEKNEKNKSNIKSDGSIMIIIATNAPLNERQLKRLSKRAGVGLGRTGSHIAHGSGDIVIAFSTAQTFSHHTSEDKETLVQIREDHPIMNELFIGAAEATEEAIFNSLTMATPTEGRKGRIVDSLSYKLF